MSSQQRFAAILGTMDELDILPTAIEHLRRIGVSLIMVLDYGSTDGTLEYLVEAEAAGDIWLWHPSREDPTEVWGFIRAELARVSGADWVLFLDSDEFWLPASGSLHDLPELDDADVLSVMRYNVVLGSDGPQLPSRLGPSGYRDTLIYAQPIRDFATYMEKHPATPWIQGQLEPKLMARPQAIAATHAGDHSLDVRSGTRWRHAVASRVLIAHVPFRTLERFERRSSNVRDAISLVPDRYTDGIGWQWVRYARMADAGQTREEFERQILSDNELQALRVANVVRSVSDVFEQLIPVLTTEQEYLDMVLRAQPWLSLAGLACRLEGIEPNQPLQHVSTGHRAVGPCSARPSCEVLRCLLEERHHHAQQGARRASTPGQGARATGASTCRDRSVRQRVALRHPVEDRGRCIR